jgi:hypothetical protein
LSDRRDELRERMSRWAAGITLGFMLVEWPAILLLRDAWKCDDCGRQIVTIGVVGLMLAPVSALLFMLTRKVTARWFVRALLGVAGVALFAALTFWAGAAGALLRNMSTLGAVLNSFVLALVMAVYCAAVVGGSWMSAVGVARLEGKTE